MAIMYECFVYIRSYNALTLPALRDEFIHEGTTTTECAQSYMKQMVWLNILEGLSIVHPQLSLSGCLSAHKRFSILL